MRIKPNRLKRYIPNFILILGSVTSFLIAPSHVFAATQTLNIDLLFREPTSTEMSLINTNIGSYTSYLPQSGSNPAGITDTTAPGWSTDPTGLPGHDGEVANAMVIIADLPELTSTCTTADNSTVNFSGNFDMVDTSDGVTGIGDYGFAMTNSDITSTIAARFNHYDSGTTLPLNGVISGSSFLPPVDPSLLSSGKLITIVETWDDGQAVGTQTLNKWNVYNVAVNLSYDDEGGTCQLSTATTTLPPTDPEPTPNPTSTSTTPTATTTTPTAPISATSSNPTSLASTGSNTIYLTILTLSLATLAGLSAKRGMKRVRS